MYFLFLMLLISSLMDMNAANLGRRVGLSLICVSLLLTIWDMVLSTSPTWVTHIGVFSFSAGFLLLLCDIPKIGGKPDKICAYFTLLYWKNVLVKNRISIDGVELDAESGDGTTQVNGTRKPGCSSWIRSRKDGFLSVVWPRS